MVSAMSKPVCFVLGPPILFATRVLPLDGAPSPGEKLDNFLFASSAALPAAVEPLLFGGYGPVPRQPYRLHISKSAPSPLGVLGSSLGRPTLMLISIFR